MWVEHNKDGESSTVPATPDAALYLMERSLPVLMANTMLAVKEFTDEIAGSNPRANGGTKEFIVTIDAAARFTQKITDLVAVRREEQALHGSVYMPYEGRPHHGFRDSGKILDEDINRKITGVNTIWEQLLDKSETLIESLAGKLRHDNEGKYYMLANQRLLSIVTTYTIPDAEAWRPKIGFRYSEVMAAVKTARGIELEARELHSIEAGKSIPEGRIVPFLHEILSPTDIVHVSKRVSTNAALGQAQNSLLLDLSAAVAQSRPERHQPQPKPAQAKPAATFQQGGLF